VVALSLAMSARPQVRYAEIPASDYSPIQQACVVLKSSKNQEFAAKFEAYLRTDEVKKIFERFGFEVPTQTGQTRP
jgi:molybdate transport system substrate-binding protein